MSLKDISMVNFKVVVLEITDRLKICSSLGQFMEDVADLENNLGKNLTKVS